MNYKTKFEESEQKAYYQNIATKILKEMSELRSLVESSQTAPRRWIWELIQNAKDVHDNDGVRIKMEYQPNIDIPYISFKHNGKPFTAENIRFLIEQISTKDRKKDEEGKSKTTGRFGTGFLTTHLLSEKVNVKGIAKEDDLEYKKFELELDRSGFDIEQIIDAVKSSKKAVQDLDNTPGSEYIKGCFDTEFLYKLVDPVSLRVAKSGIDDLDNCLSYTLAFVHEIKEVEILPSNQNYSKPNEKENIADNFSLVSIFINKNQNKPDNIKIAILKKGLTSIAFPVEKIDGQINLLTINEQIPRLYCDFPLIGTEKFYFPVIVNNPNFNPTDARDGVFLTKTERSNPGIDENKNIIKDAISLYFKLLDYAVDNKWGNLHLLAQIKPLPDSLDWVDKDWFKTEVLNPIREKILYSQIIKNSNDVLTSILRKDGKPNIWFPNSTIKEVRNKIWELANFCFPSKLPNKLDIELWNDLSWAEFGKLNINKFSSFLSDKICVEDLSKCLGEKDVYEWLNEFYILLKQEKTEYDNIINNFAIFPNQNGAFCKKAQLKGDKGDIEVAIKDILNLLGKDIRKELCHIKIKIEFDDECYRDLTFACDKITTEVNNITTNREDSKKYSSAFNKLLVWFKENPKNAESLFPLLYKNKHLLYDDDVIVSNIAKAEQLEDLLKEYDALDITALKQLIAKGQSSNSILPVTQEILTSMGILSLEEWLKALENKDLKELFSHESTPTEDMFIYAQSIIEKAKTNIIKHLKTLPDYDLSCCESTATTILSGVRKNNIEISIVARPAYFGEVIIYYGSERDVLDFEYSELWIDDSKEQRKISLGHILKTAGINKFPI